MNPPAPLSGPGLLKPFILLLIIILQDKLQLSYSHLLEVWLSLSYHRLDEFKLVGVEVGVRRVAVLGMKLTGLHRSIVLRLLGRA